MQFDIGFAAVFISFDDVLAVDFCDHVARLQPRSRSP